MCRKTIVQEKKSIMYYEKRVQTINTAKNYDLDGKK